MMTEGAVLVSQNLKALRLRRTQWQQARNRAVRQERERVAAIKAREAEQAAIKRLFAELRELETKLPAVITTRDNATEAVRATLDEQVLELTQHMRAVRAEFNAKLRARQL